MFIINLTYTVSLEMVDQHLEDHVRYLNEQYEVGNFMASGRKVPRSGGIILSGIHKRSDLETVLAKDPFQIHQLAAYEIIEFIPSKTNKDLSFLLD